MRADLVLVGAMVFAGALGLLMWPAAGAEDYRIALGTVVQPAQCGPPDAHDVLRVDLLDGTEISARLDGCGNRQGEVLTVEVPVPLSAGRSGQMAAADAAPGASAAGQVAAGEVVVRLAGTGLSATTATAARLSAVGVSIAGIGGAVLVWWLRLAPERAGRKV